MLTWLSASLNCQTSSTSVKSRCYRFEMKHYSATAWPLLHQCLFRNWFWQIVEEKFLTFPELPKLFFCLRIKGKDEWYSSEWCVCPVRSREGLCWCLRDSEFRAAVARLFLCAHLTTSKTGFCISPSYNSTNPIYQFHVYWRIHILFWVAAVIKKNCSSTKNIKWLCWQLNGSPQFVSSLLKVQQKLVWRWGLFSLTLNDV